MTAVHAIRAEHERIAVAHVDEAHLPVLQVAEGRRDHVAPTVCLRLLACDGARLDEALDHAVWGRQPVHPIPANAKEHRVADVEDDTTAPTRHPRRGR